MKTFVVAYVSLFDNDLTQEIVTADTPEEAIWKHSKFADPCWEPSEAGDKLEDIEGYLFDCDILATVTEIA